MDTIATPVAVTDQHRHHPKYQEIERLIREHGYIAIADHPGLRHQLQYLQRRRLLRPLCPGHLVRAGTEDDPDLRIRVVSAWHPDGVLLGAAAARASFAPDIAVPVIVMATTRKRRSPAGVRLVRWQVPDEHVAEHHGLRHTRPALTALDLARDDDGATIDEVLRRGLATLAHLHRALRATPYRLGNPVRRFLVDDSRDEPWSPAERLAHRILRAAGITGWSTNLRVSLPQGRHGFIDIAFDHLGIAIEIDGHGHHGHTENRAQFEQDRWKRSSIAADGWTVLQLTYRQLTEQLDWVLDVVSRTIQQRTWWARGRRARRREDHTAAA